MIGLIQKKLYQVNKNVVLRKLRRVYKFVCDKQNILNMFHVPLKKYKKMQKKLNVNQKNK